MAIGDRVVIVANAPGWTVREMQLYGGRMGVVRGVAVRGGRSNWLVQIYGGEADGESRWFPDSEIAETLGRELGR